MAARSGGWRRIHIGIDEKSPEIRAAELTTSGYHRRSRAETRMHCVKLPGQRLSAREFDRQAAEFQVRVVVLNGFTAPGMPITEAAR